jgi:hypothetical protein
MIIDMFNIPVSKSLVASCIRKSGMTRKNTLTRTCRTCSIGRIQEFKRRLVGHADAGAPE